MIILLLAAALQASPGAAELPATPVAPVKVVAAASDRTALTTSGKVVCREDQKTGSRLTSRTCHTEREWRELEFQSDNWMREMRPLGCSGSNVGVCAGPR